MPSYRNLWLYNYTDCKIAYFMVAIYETIVFTRFATGLVRQLDWSNVCCPATNGRQIILRLLNLNSNRKFLAATNIEGKLKNHFWKKKHTLKFICQKTWIYAYLEALWPDWAIYLTLGNFLKPLTTIYLPKSRTFLGNFCKGVKIYHFCSELIFGNFYRHLMIFSNHTP